LIFQKQRFPKRAVLSCPSSIFQAMKDYSFVANAHPSYIESLYNSFKSNPASVETDWRMFFEGFEYAQSANGNGHSAASTAATSVQMPTEYAAFDKEFRVLRLIYGYRDRGHLLSDTNPIRPRKDRQPRLDLSDYGLSEGDLVKKFAAGHEIGLDGATLLEIIAKLKVLYCGKIGFENAHIFDAARRMWLRQKVENRSMREDFGFSTEKKKRILSKLNGAVGFEDFLHKKFVGQKRFSLEGGESTIPALDAIMNHGAANEVEEVIIGMAHRGRLNVLANTLGKTHDQIFNEFEGKNAPDSMYGSGDVKYHLGFSSQVKTDSGKEIYVRLLPNPSHLEAVDPVVEGYARAKVDLLYAHRYDAVLPILIHGDAAVAGQGIVYETLQMSQLKGYHTGGTVHLVINNQIGFTTNFEDARSSSYATSVAEVVQAPVFHVNGDDPEAVVFACELATEYRQMFNSDVFIDLVCYRRWGHNESDEPRFTQPQMYEIIEKQKNVRVLYTEKLMARHEIDKAMAEEMEKNYFDELQNRLDAVRQNQLPYKYQEPEMVWKTLRRTGDAADFQNSPETGVSRAILNQLTTHLLRFPENFTPLKQIGKLYENSQKLVADGKTDWAMAELLAYASLLADGKDVRMSGQDVKRGTFSHRHACIMDAKNYAELNRLDGISENQGKFRIFNSLLSEYAVLGFEYGYSLASPDPLVIWEAQFGDFANGASTIIDQFIFSGESKWGRMSGIMMLLPHGYEGQGPEHSSARLERFLSGCAEFNIAVANISTAANFFHLIRRQQMRPFRKPLVVMSPKSLFRSPLVVSDLKEMETGTRFQELLDDASADANLVKTLIVTSGKFYYDLAKFKTENNRKDVAIVRLEQIYPFPKQQFDALLKKYKNAKTIRWAQEEPMNAGAFGHLLLTQSEYGWKYAGRPAAASPASGYPKMHDAEQNTLVTSVFKD
jgi:2-oxoglutarate dehydrogenase E1 component